MRFHLDEQVNPRIAYCHQTAMSTGEIVHYLSLMAQVMVDEEMRGHVEFMKRL